MLYCASRELIFFFGYRVAKTKFFWNGLMRAVVLTGIRQMELVDVPEPSIEKDDDVLLKIERVGVCGSDLHYYETGRIGSQIIEYPFIIGH